MTASRPIEQTGRGTWSVAFLIAVGLHAGLVAVLVAASPLTPDPVTPSRPEPIQFVFEPPPAPAADDGPHEFTELPEDRADEAPDHPDFLSNVTSRARDEASGQSNLPRLEGISDAPHLRMDPGGGTPSKTGDIDPQETSEQTQTPPAETAETRVPDLPERDADRSADVRDDEMASFLQPRQDPRNVRRPDRAAENPSPAQERMLLLSGGGIDDILQHALDNPEGGTPLSGAISLSTLAWPYAPWLQRFRREFLAGWTAPYAWRMGLIDGSHVLELEIAPSGKLLRLDVIQKEGSDVLVENSRFSLETMAPYEPLPEDFPDETLILRIQLTYHHVPTRTRPPRATQEAPDGGGP